MRCFLLVTLVFPTHKNLQEQYLKYMIDCIEVSKIIIIIFFLAQIIMFSPVLDMCVDRIKDVTSLVQSEIDTHMNILHFFAKHVGLAEVIVQQKSRNRCMSAGIAFNFIKQATSFKDLFQAACSQILNDQFFRGLSHMLAMLCAI